MKLSFVTLFPELISSYFSFGIVSRALSRQIISLDLIDIRQFGQSKHRIVDDYPYGGGPGMLLKPEPVSKAILRALSANKKGRVVFLTATGVPFSQSIAETLAKHHGLIFVCGRYEGIDERVADVFAHYRISIGPYVLNGGELPSLVVAESVIRLLPGVLGNEMSIESDSYSDSFEYEPPRYTRPESFLGLKVPDYLLSGNHENIRLESEQLGKLLRRATVLDPLNKT